MSDFWEPECPGRYCLMCSGEACNLCGAGCWNNAAPRCEHGTDERHRTMTPDRHAMNHDAPTKTIEGLLEEFGTPDGPQPVAPAWHVESDACSHGWIIGGTEWGMCDCEDPSNPWPTRIQGDGPRDCMCFFCMNCKLRHLRGKIAECEYKDHHCDDCHEQRRCTTEECYSVFDVR